MKGIESKCLLLFPVDVEMISSLQEGDDAFLFRYGFTNDAGEYLNPHPKYLADIKDRLLSHPEEYPLAVDQLIILKESKTVIGTIYFKSLPQNGECEIGYGMNPAYEGNGYMTEALMAMLEFGKANGVARITAETTVDNIKSQNVLRRSGFAIGKAEGNHLWFSYNF